MRWAALRSSPEPRVTPQGCCAAQRGTSPLATTVFRQGLAVAADIQMLIVGQACSIEDICTAASLQSLVTALSIKLPTYTGYFLLVRRTDPK